jgi:hypothetical protein
MVSQDAQEKLEQELAQLLQQAHDLGTQYGNAMVDHKKEAVSLKKIATGLGIAYFLKRAKDVVVGLIGRIRDTVSDIVSKGGDAQETITHMLDYLPNQAAATAIHTEVENAVMDVFDDEQVEQIEVVCEPGACQLCLDNQDAGSIDRGTEFPSGHTRAPFHYSCRCIVVPA